MYNYPIYPTYQQTYSQLQNSANNTPTDERIWVQGEASAEAYLLAPNGFVRLWDSSTNRFYEKRADATGRLMPMDIYEYTRILPNTGANNNSVDKSLIEDINGQIGEIRARLEALESTKKGANKNGKQSATDDTSI